MHSVKQKIMAVLPLTVISLLCVMTLFTVQSQYREKIQINQQRHALAILTDVITLNYNNDLFNDKLELAVPAEVSRNRQLTVYRARENDRLIALGFMPIALKGYGGEIQLLVGINADGHILSVRVLHHNETDGFGDRAHQAKSDWLTVFNDISLDDHPEDSWATKKDGGEFDQLSGATITSRSIIRAVYQVLTFYSENHNTLLQ